MMSSSRCGLPWAGSLLLATVAWACLACSGGDAESDTPIGNAGTLGTGVLSGGSSSGTNPSGGNTLVAANGGSSQQPNSRATGGFAAGGSIAGSTGGSPSTVGAGAGGSGGMSAGGNRNTGSAGTGSAGTGSAGTGGVSGLGGAVGRAGASSGGRAAGGSKSTGGSTATGGMNSVAGSTGQSCPYTGQVSYTLAKVSNPTADQLAAYDRITAAMDTAVHYYNCYTNIKKALKVSYVPSVPTADGNINGSIRFGSTASMNRVTATHETSHTVGIGTASNWGSFISNGQFTGSNALARLLQIAGRDRDTIGADAQHFWPYGLNYEKEGKTEADFINHCSMVMAIRKDLGMN